MALRKAVQAVSRIDNVGDALEGGELLPGTCSAAARRADRHGPAWLPVRLSIGGDGPSGPGEPAGLRSRNWPPADPGLAFVGWAGSGRARRLVARGTRRTGSNRRGPARGDSRRRRPAVEACTCHEGYGRGPSEYTATGPPPDAGGWLPLRPQDRSALAAQPAEWNRADRPEMPAGGELAGFAFDAATGEAPGVEARRRCESGPTRPCAPGGHRDSDLLRRSGAGVGPALAGDGLAVARAGGGGPALGGRRGGARHPRRTALGVRAALRLGATPPSARPIAEYQAVSFPLTDIEDEPATPVRLAALRRRPADRGPRTDPGVIERISGPGSPNRAVGVGCEADTAGREHPRRARLSGGPPV